MRSGWQRSATGAACLWAAGWRHLAAGLMVFALAWAIGEPGVFTALSSRWRRNPQGAPGEWAAPADAGVGATALAGGVVASAFWLAGPAWTLAAWNALRIAFGAGPLRSAVAGAVSLAAFAGLLWAVLWAAGD